MRKIRIAGIGIYLPDNKVTSYSLDEHFQLPPGSIAQKSGVDSRHFASSETSSFMGKIAAQRAIENANLNISDIDCIVSACGVMEQAIPVTAVLIQKALGLENTCVPCFDINSTCLSFVTALDVISYMVASKRYKNVLIVSSEQPSKGINPEDINTYSLFGDGAAAVVIQNSDSEDNSEILHAKIETYTAAMNYCIFEGAGTKYNPTAANKVSADKHYFKMDGKSVYKQAIKLVPNFIDKFFEETPFSISDIDVVIPHQASGIALQHMQKELQIPNDRFVNIIATHGNQMAASIPTALYSAINAGQLKRGQTALLIGTGAGLSISAVLIRY